MVIWPEASRAQNSMAAVSTEGSTVCVLIRRLCEAVLRTLMQPLDGVRGPRRFPLARGQPGESEQRLAGFLQAVGDGAALQPPLAQVGTAPRLDLLRGLGVDHVGVVGRDLL